jgi:hypothetical protein
MPKPTLTMIARTFALSVVTLLALSYSQAQDIKSPAGSDSSFKRILAINGMKLILIDRESKAVVWESAGLQAPLSLSSIPGGDYLVGEKRTIARIDKNGNLLSRSPAKFQMVNDVKALENGYLLISDGPAKTVIEVDSEGKIVWSVAGLHFPSEAIRLASGNTMIADGSAVLKEFDSSGKLVRSIALRKWAGAIQSVPEGYLVGESSAVELLDNTGRPIWSYAIDSRVTCVQQLAAGEYLLCEPDVGRIVIMDSAGYVKWEMTGLRYPWHALYLG